MGMLTVRQECRMARDILPVFVARVRKPHAGPPDSPEAIAPVAALLARYGA